MGAPRGGRRSVHRGKHPARHVWAEADGRLLVGRHIQVKWPQDNSVYTALVVDFFPAENQHKILYHSDESIEVLELGDGPRQRPWNYFDKKPKDPLEGKKIFLYDHGEAPGNEWFDFMRDDSQNTFDKFQVIVVQRIKDVVEDDVIGPMASGKHAFYRVMNTVNEYLALIDLAATDYEHVSTSDGEPDSVPSPAVEPDDVFDDKPQHDYPSPNHLDDEHKSDPEPLPTSSSRRHVSDDPHPPERKPDAPLVPDTVDDDMDIDIDKVAKVVSADRVVETDDRYESRAPDDIDVAIDDAPLSSLKEPSGSQETHDEPVEQSGSRKRRVVKSASALPDLFDDEEDEQQDSEGDSRWNVKSKSKNVVCDVGDFISLDTGIGGAPRTAYIEAYLPEAGTHFVAFCDRRGGNLQIKLTPDNHYVLSEAEGKKLAKKKQSDVYDDDYDEGKNEPDLLSDEATPPKTRRTPKRKGKLTSSRPVKRPIRYQRTPEIKGKAANQDICGRCISIVWPGENLVYVALVLGYSPYSKQHQVVYMLDHCIETLNLKYREWTLLPREKEPWMDNGLVGKRLYVFWPGEYDDEDSQKLARKAFGDDTKVPYEAYVLSYLGERKYKIIYPATEDTEIRVLRATDSEGASALEKEWDLLDYGVNEIDGLPVICWTD